jgi:flagellar biosynthesis/type III secretory pathway protein FliH
MNEFEAQRQISAAYNEGKRDGYEQARKEFAELAQKLINKIEGRTE